MSETFHFSPRPNRAAEIAWRPWDESAFAEARRAEKPVLLAISAVWCHWCHVMDETTYSDPAVISMINEQFIPIRVDNDRRPDVNARYNMGGWPTTAFLTPDGQMLTGGTYIPAHQMRSLLQKIAHVFAEHRDDIVRAAGTFAPRAIPSAQGPVSAAIVDAVVNEITSAYDPEHGGFGTEPKFPQPEALELLLLECRLGRDARIGAMLHKTAIAMASGGMYDHVAGGFFRYATRADWSIPHFEKMAEDHAGLLRFYAGLARVDADPIIIDTLRSAAAYVRMTLRDPATRLFAGSQDADETYYELDAASRATLDTPFIDRTSYTNWTAALAGALAHVGAVLDDAGLIAESVMALDAIDERLIDADGLAYHYVEPGQAPQVRGLLIDQVALLRALVDVHAVSGEARLRDRAERLAGIVAARFLDASGAFIDHLNAQTALGNVRHVDRQLPENGLLADALLQLAILCDDERWTTVANRALSAFSEGYAKAGSFAAPYARAVRRSVNPTTSITIVGGIEETAALRRAALADADPLAVIRTIDPREASRLERAALPASGAACAYVCHGTTCSAPIKDPLALGVLLQQQRVDLSEHVR